MRIFSIHKSKSKKQISEKTPKLAANKFLEKKKVGTVIYLHEHPSGKIHGPYRKEYDKKIMKGGLSIEHFRVDRPELLRGTEQLIIKRPRVGFLSNEPRLFFGDNKNKDSQGNFYYTYALKNRERTRIFRGFNINNLMLFRELKFSDNGTPAEIRDLTHDEVIKISPVILLGLYTQYIDRCKQDFPDSGPIRTFLEDIYMRRLFYYLFIHILPVITAHILNTYIGRNRVQQNSVIHNFKDKLKNEPELKYFMNIISFLNRVDIRAFASEITRICDLTEEQFQNIISNLELNTGNFKSLSPQEELNSIRQSLRQNRNNSSTNLVGNIVISSATSGVNPMQVVEFIGFVISIPFRIIFFFMQFAG